MISRIATAPACRQGLGTARDERRANRGDDLVVQGPAEQREVFAPLNELAAITASRGITGPSIIIVGEVVALAPAYANASRVAEGSEP